MSEVIIVFGKLEGVFESPQISWIDCIYKIMTVKLDNLFNVEMK